jgi:hypothetical protein
MPPISGPPDEAGIAVDSGAAIDQQPREDAYFVLHVGAENPARPIDVHIDAGHVFGRHVTAQLASNLTANRDQMFPTESPPHGHLARGGVALRSIDRQRRLRIAGVDRIEAVVAVIVVGQPRRR